MERNIRHVQRWLERCLEAYRHRRQGAALAELESARAELEIAREMLADELAGEKRPSWMFRGVLIAMISLVMLFALVLPTAYQADSVVSQADVRTGTSVSPLDKFTEEERLHPQDVRRASTSDNVQSSSSESPPEVSVLPRLKAKTEDGPVSAVPEGNMVTAVSENIEKKLAQPRPVAPASDKLENGVPAPSVEEVLSLLQAGQRALQNPRKGIPIQP